MIIKTPAGGGISLVSKALSGAFIATQAIVCCYASEDSKINLTRPQFKKLQSRLAYIDYAITANNAIALEKDRTKWYTKLKYRKSVINEIGHAIEKCLLGENMYVNDVVVFYENMDPKGFTQANYNAWLLYNYVDQVIRTNIDVTLYKVADTIKGSYTVDKAKMNKAIHDIGEYLKINELNVCLMRAYENNKKTTRYEQMTYENCYSNFQYKEIKGNKTRKLFTYEGGLDFSWSDDLKYRVLHPCFELEKHHSFYTYFTGSTFDYTNFEEHNSCKMNIFYTGHCAYSFLTKYLKTICKKNLLVNIDELSDYDNWSACSIANFQGKRVFINAIRSWNEGQPYCTIKYTELNKKIYRLQPRYPEWMK